MAPAERSGASLMLLLVVMFALVAAAFETNVSPKFRPKGGDLRVDGYEHGILRFQIQHSIPRPGVPEAVVVEPLKASALDVEVEDHYYTVKFEKFKKSGAYIDFTSLRINRQNLETMFYAENDHRMTFHPQDTLDRTQAWCSFVHGPELYFDPTGDATDGFRKMQNGRIEAAEIPIGKRHHKTDLQRDEEDMESRSRAAKAWPLVLAHTKEYTFGLVWMPAVAPTFMEHAAQEHSVRIGWSSYEGHHDLFILPGPTPHDVVKQMRYLTGRPPLPPMAAFGLHFDGGSSLEELEEADNQLDFMGIPCDVLHVRKPAAQKGRLPSLFNPTLFPAEETKTFLAKLAAKGRHLSFDVDPVVSPLAAMVDQGSKAKHFVMADGGEKEADAVEGGEGGEGGEKYRAVDFVHTKARQWYMGELAKALSMNNGTAFAHLTSHEAYAIPERGSHKLSDGGRSRHSPIHNTLGFYGTMALGNGLRKKQRRAFVTTEDPFLSSHRFGVLHLTPPATAKKSDDEDAQENVAVAVHRDSEGGDVAVGGWDYMKSARLLCSAALRVGQVAFTSVGGAPGEVPSDEMIVRWFQNGAVNPFFRFDSGAEGVKRSPWHYDEDTVKLIRAAVVTRYRLLPYIYTTAFLGALDGSSTVFPLLYEVPHDKLVASRPLSYFLGPSLIVRPVVENRPIKALISTPTQYIQWYNFYTGYKYAKDVVETMVDAPTSMLPMVVRGGRIVPMYAAPATPLRTAKDFAAKGDMELIVALDVSKAAKGVVFIDDEETDKYTRGDVVLREIVFDLDKLRCTAAVAGATAAPPYGHGHVKRAPGSKFTAPHTRVQTVKVFGFEPKNIQGAYVVYRDGPAEDRKPREVDIEVDDKFETMTLTDVDLEIGRDWELVVGKK